MDGTTLKQYLTDDPPTVARLEIKPHFEALSQPEKKYAHFISRAAFAGHRINLRQVSPESEDIYDFILALHEASNGMMSPRYRSSVILTVNDKATGRSSSLTLESPTRIFAHS